MRLDRLISAGAAFLILVLGCAAPGTGDPDASADAPEVFDYPPPRTDLVPPVGTAVALDVATWNIENYPFVAATPEIAADLIASMDLDLVAVQEIANTDAFDELVDRLRGYDAVLSTHTYGNGSYQKIGFIYRESLLSVEAGFLLFDNDFSFPRPALQVMVAADDGVNPPLDFIAIAVHLKAGQGDEDLERRIDAATKLESHMRSNVDGSGDDDLLLLGDFNQTPGEFAGQVFAPFTGAVDRYDIRTAPLFDDGQISHINSDRLIDHVVTTASLRAQIGPGVAQIPPLHEQLDNYNTDVSDHLPVVLSIPLAAQ
jgi:endonuclease/exonuclease/phosphatase family metal-dependent hydrolase